MKEYRLIDICKPKQWKTLSIKELKSSGYPVYGANGVVGFHNEYTHERPTLLITCRGATCGELNICQPYSYVNGNAMALDALNEDRFDIKYLYYALKKRGLSDVITGSAQPQITRASLSNVIICFPDIKEQKQIASILDISNGLIDKRKQAITKFDELVKAIFLDMFGDPITNKKGYPVGTIKDLIIDAKYGTSKKANEGTGQFPYLRMNNITYQGYMDYSNLKYIDLDDKEQEKYLVQRGDLLFNRTNSKELVGKTAVFDSDEKMAIAGYIVRVKTNDAGNPYFISGYLNSKHGKKVLQEMCKNIIGMANINAQELQNITILIPPRELQDSYERKVKAILEEKKKHLTQLQHLESNFQGLLQKAFKGELAVKDGVAV